MLTDEEELFCISGGKHGIKMFCCRVLLKELLACQSCHSSYVNDENSSGHVFSLAPATQGKYSVRKELSLMRNGQLLPSSLAFKHNKTNRSHSLRPEWGIVCHQVSFDYITLYVFLQLCQRVSLFVSLFPFLAPRCGLLTHRDSEACDASNGVLRWKSLFGGFILISTHSPCYPLLQERRPVPKRGRRQLAAVAHNAPIASLLSRRASLIFIKSK